MSLERCLYLEGAFSEVFTVHLVVIFMCKKLLCVVASFNEGIGLAMCIH